MNPASAGPSTRSWSVLVAVSLPLAALSVDVSGAGVLLPSIGDDLDMSPAARAWVVNAAALTFGASLMAAGAVADRFGPKRLLVVGITAFGLTSLVCAAAPDGATLVIGRAGQGLASALCFTTSLSVLDAGFPGDLRARAVGIWGAIGGIGTAVGPLVAGGLATALSWRWFFAVNVPVCVAAVGLITVLAPPEAPTSQSVVPWRRLSGLGAAFAAISLAGGLAGAPRPVGLLVVTGAFAVAALALLGLARRRRERPVLPPGITGAPLFPPTMFVAFCSSWGLAVTLVVMSEYLQVGRGLSAVGAGFVTLAFTVPFAVAGFRTGPLIGRTGLRVALVGSMAVCAVAFALRLGLDPTTTWVLVVAGLVVGGVGQGLAFDVSTASSLDGVPEDRAGVVTGAAQSVRLLGFLLGVALWTAVIEAADSRSGPGADTLSEAVRICMVVAAAVAVVGAFGAALSSRSAARSGRPWSRSAWRHRRSRSSPTRSGRP